MTPHTPRDPVAAGRHARMWCEDCGHPLEYHHIGPWQAVPIPGGLWGISHDDMPGVGAVCADKASAQCAAAANNTHERRTP